MPYQIDDLSEDPNVDEEEEVGFFTSALAGIATGLYKIPTGFVSLGAELVDLGLDTNTAASVEKFFDDLNPLDEYAEARTIGRVTQALAQIAPIGIVGAIKGAKYGTQVANRLFSKQKEIAKGLARKALDAKKAGRAFKLAGFGRKISKTGFAVVGGGIGEAIVADEEIGTLADMLQGTSLEGAALTMMDRETKEGRSDAYRRLMNRVKFGTEGALFNLGIIGAGKGIKRLRTPSKEPLLAYSDNMVVRTLQKYVQFGFKPEGVGTKTIHEFSRQALDEMSAVNFKAIEEGKDLVKEIDKIFPTIEKALFQKKGKALTSIEKESARLKIMKDLKDVLKVEGVGAQEIIKPSTKKAAQKLFGKKSELASKANRQSLQQLKEKLSYLMSQRKTLFNEGDSFKQISPEQISLRPDVRANRQQIIETVRKIKDSNTAIKSLKELQRRGGSIFKITNYDLDKAPQIQAIKKMLGGTKEQADKMFEPIDKIIKSMRAGVDNMSYRFFDNEMPEELAKVINDQVGSYMTTDYRLYVQGGILNQYKPLAQDKMKSVAKRYDELLKDPKNINRPKESLKAQADKDVINYLKRGNLEDPTNQRLLNKDAGKTIKSNLTKQESEGLKINSDVLLPRKLKEFQKIVAGEIQDPTFVFHSTATKLANLNSNTKFLNNMYDIMSSGKGPNKLIFTKDELLNTPGLANQIDNVNKFKQVKSAQGINGMNPLEGHYLRAPVYDEIFSVSNKLLNDDNIISQLYRYGILAPKVFHKYQKLF